MTTRNRWPARLAPLLVAGACALPAAASTRELQFDVYFDDRRIGDHRFLVEADGDALRVRSEARFEYRLLFVPLYRYRHDAVEHWRNGCLEHLESETDDNGRRVAVDGLPDVDSACPGSFAYWDVARLQRDALINAQTGEPVAARLVPDGEDRLDGQAVRRYRLELADMPDIALWYAADDGAWLALETRRDNGTLRYRSRALTDRTARPD